MITERQFAGIHNAFWNTELPFAEKFVRSMNLQVKRYGKPVKPGIEKGRRAFVSELGFNIVVTSISESTTPSTLTEDAIAKLAYQTENFLDRFRDYENSGATLDSSEISEALALAASALAFLSPALSKNKRPIPRPQFAGCGIVDHCEGDLIVGSTLYELKAVTRTFRSSDFRQILVYLALNHAQPRYELSTIVLLNPRRSTFLKLPIGLFTRQMSDREPSELFCRIIEYISSETGSGQ